MISQEKLLSLSSEALQALREGVEKAIAYKARRTIRVGSVVKWNCVKEGRFITLRVNNFGPKNVHGHEIDVDGRELVNRKWRVSPGLLIIQDEPKPIPRAPVGSDRPMSMVGTF